MTTIVTRAGKGSALSFSEADANLNNLNNDKIEADTTDTLTNKSVDLASNTLTGTCFSNNSQCCFHCLFVDVRSSPIG